LVTQNKMQKSKRKTLRVLQFFLKNKKIAQNAK
jgi:hypothetical protein